MILCILNYFNLRNSNIQVLNNIHGSRFLKILFMVIKLIQLLWKNCFMFFKSWTPKFTMTHCFHMYVWEIWYTCTWQAYIKISLVAFLILTKTETAQMLIFIRESINKLRNIHVTAYHAVMQVSTVQLCELMNVT